MCGFSGFVYTEQSSWFSISSLQNLFASYAKNIDHRGNEPLKILNLDKILLAHARLAFQDLQNNIQPMLSNDGHWLIIYNGEIYNFKNLRKEIIKNFGYNFRTNGDTEVILAGYICYGESIVEQLEGEYSFVIFKKDASEVFAARDYFGVKPQFIALEGIDTLQFANAKNKYNFTTNSIQFCSEIKGIFGTKKWNKDGFLRQAVGLYEPIRTPFENIIALPAGAKLYAKKLGPSFTVELTLNNKPIRKNLPAISNDFNEFRTYFRNSVRDRLVSDVELGVYLSGGIDSRVTCYELANYYEETNLKKRLKAFHISFTDKDYDESDEVKKFSKKFLIDLNIVKVTKENLQYSYPLAVYYSENIQPYTNGAAKWWLSLFASKYVKGVLTGDGADELLCGYPSFQYINWWKFALRNRSGRNVFDKLKNHPLCSNWRDFIYQKKFVHHKNNPWAYGSSHEGNGTDFIESLQTWGVPHPLFGQIKTITYALLGEDLGFKWLCEQRESVQSWFVFGLDGTEDFLLNPENSLLLWQNYFCKTHLPVQVLNWVGDRMEMANALEGRTPFLSKHLRNYVYNLPDNALVRGFQEKAILRNAYKDVLGQFAFNPKRQFGSPILFSLNSSFQKDEVISNLNKFNLCEINSVKNLFKINPNNKDIYKSTHLNSALQTLNSFALLHRFFVEEEAPKRDFDYESKI